MLTEDRQSILRLTFGVTLVFSLGLILGWPLAVIGSVFTAVFLQSPVAMPTKVSIKLFTFAIALMAVSWLVFSMLLPYPAVFLIGVALAIIISFGWSISGAGILPGVLSLMAAMMIPNIVVQSGELAAVLVFWIPANLLIAGYVSAVCFFLFPPPPAENEPKKPETSQPDFDPARRLLRMSMVTVPFALVFFLFEWSAVLVLFFVALLSQQLAATTFAGKSVAKAMLTANLFGAAVSILFYEINVLAPVIVTPVLLCMLLCLVMGTLSKSSHFLAPAAGSALTTVLVIYGGSIAPFADEADVKSIVRVLYIVAAAGFVIISYIVVDEFLPERKKFDETKLV